MVVNHIHRQLNIADFALGSLTRRLARNAAVVCIFALVIFLVASFSLTVTSLKESARRLLGTVPDIMVQQMSAGRQIPLDLKTVDQLEGIFGIQSIRLRVWGYYFDENNGANYTVIGHPDVSVKPQLPGLGIDYLAEKEFGPTVDQVVLGRAVLDNLDLQGRRTFSFFRPDLNLKSFAVAGVFSPNTSLVTGDLIVMDLTAAQDLFGMSQDEITDILVEVVNPLEIDTVSAKISERLEGVRVITRERITKTYQAVFGWRSGFGLACLLGAVAAFFILAWEKASGLTPDQRREVAILRVLGWQTEDVITLRFWESFIISALAFTLGYLAAWIHLLFFEGAFLRPVLLGWSVLRPPVTLVPVFNFSDLLIIFSLSILPYLAATVIPAWHSATIRPESVI